MQQGKHKNFNDLVKDNPSGDDELTPCHNFSSNPGFVSPIARTGVMMGGVGAMHSTRPQQSVVSSGRTMGRTADRGFGSVSNPAPGSTDPKSDGGPMGVTSGYNG